MSLEYMRDITHIILVVMTMDSISEGIILTQNM
jgi:hypothetical protein